MFQLPCKVFFLKQSLEHSCLLQSVIKKDSWMNWHWLWPESDFLIASVAKEEKESMTVSFSDWFTNIQNKYWINKYALLIYRISQA